MTWGIAIPSGALVGFIASRLPTPKRQFCDTESFENITYGDDSAKFNIPFEHVKLDAHTEVAVDDNAPGMSQR